LLPQLAGSFDLGGFGVSGDGDAAWNRGPATR
jgi:hypothetical protein